MNIIIFLCYLPEDLLSFLYKITIIRKGLTEKLRLIKALLSDTVK